MKSIIQKLFLGALCATMLSPVFAPAQISEPETIFYGQVINRTSGQLDLITVGNLVWRIARPDGRQITLAATLRPLNNGQFSDRLSVPHQALTYGLFVTPDSVPLAVALADCSLLTMTVDGAPASIVAPGTTLFSVNQSSRAATYRLDLELVNALASSSGDGIPDWWKARYGVTDPNGHLFADGWSNLQKFQNGTSPTQDNRFPSLATTEFWAYADGRTEIPFAAIDSDSATTNIFYRLTSLPSSGNFYLRNFSNDVTLALNSTFTQDDVNQGKLIFVHGGSNSPAGPVNFNISLNDENPAPGTNYSIWLNVYRPNYSPVVTAAASAIVAAPFGFSDITGLSFSEQQMLLNYLWSRDFGSIIGDASRAASAKTLKAASVQAGRELPHVLVGGFGADRLVGSGTNDILVGGRGNDTIEDFSTTEGDALDISRVLTGASGQLTNSVQLSNNGSNTTVAINFAGAGSGFTNLTVTLLGKQYTQADLRTLSDGGSLLTGNKALSPVISIAATIAAASQNGPVAGQFTLTRTGPIGSPLTVNLTISGSAINGTSYQLIPSSVDFASGQRTVTLPVNPYQTSTALAQIAQVSIAAGTGYGIGTTATASVSIQPLLPQITIEALEPTAIRSDLTPGTFLISRGGIIDRSVFVRLTTTGTASSSTDYNSFSSFLNFSPYQTTALISVTPKVTANFVGGPKYVQVAIKADASYSALNPNVSRVYIVDQLYTGDSWKQRFFASSSDDWNTFSRRDSGNTGIKNLNRYAFGLNPTNPSPTNGLPLYQIMNDRLSVTFRHPLSVTDLEYVVEVSDDLAHWSALSNDVENFTPPGANTNDVEMVSYRSKSAVHGVKTKQFMRVTLQPR